LIFTRELPFKEAMHIWDGVFADDPDLNLIEFICIAMLLRIRNEREFSKTTIIADKSPQCRLSNHPDKPPEISRSIK
jgi:hypothetical protein